MVLLVFRSTGLHDLLARYPGKSFYSVLHPRHEGYWQFFGRVDLGTTWFFHAPVPPGTTADNFDFHRLVHDAAGADFDLVIEHIGFWDLRFAVADTYRAGRVFIAKGIEVDRVFLRDHDPARDRPAFERAWAQRSSGTVGEVNAFEPNYEGSPVVDGAPGALCSAAGTHSFAARPGHHLAPIMLSDGRSVYAVLGEGFTLLAFDADADICRRFRSAAEAAGIPLAVVQDARTEGRERYGHAFILVRPDQFVAAVADGSAVDAGTILGEAGGKPAPSDRIGLS